MAHIPKYRGLFQGSFDGRLIGPTAIVMCWLYLLRSKRWCWTLSASPQSRHILELGSCGFLVGIYRAPIVVFFRHTESVWYSKSLSYSQGASKSRSQKAIAGYAYISRAKFQTSLKTNRSTRQHSKLHIVKLNFFEIPVSLRSGVYITLHADDISIWSSYSAITVFEGRLQTVLRITEYFIHERGMRLSAQKSAVLFFSTTQPSRFWTACPWTRVLYHLWKYSGSRMSFWIVSWREQLLLLTWNRTLRHT